MVGDIISGSRFANIFQFPSISIIVSNKGFRTKIVVRLEDDTIFLYFPTWDIGLGSIELYIEGCSIISFELSQNTYVVRNECEVINDNG